MKNPTGLPERLSCLEKGGVLLYRHDAALGNAAFLLASAEKASERSVKLILAEGSGPFLLTTTEDLVERGGPTLLQGDGAILAWDCSLAGLKALQKRIKAGNLSGEGPDRMLVRCASASRMLQDASAEARMLEACSGLSGRLLPLLCARLLSRTGAGLSPKEHRGFCAEQGIGSVSAAEVEASRFHNPGLIELAGICDVKLLQGPFRLHSFYSRIDERYHWAFCAGDPGSPPAGTVPLVRMESECLTGHVFGSRLCDCGAQLQKGLERVNGSGCGALVYLRQEGRGIGLRRKLEAYRLQQEEKLDTVDANLAQGLPSDARDYLIGAQILSSLGIKRLRLLTNNPRKVRGLEKYDIEVVERIPHVIPPSACNRKYLLTKKKRLGHLL